jgi:formate dehydrogenase subunit delta
VNSSGIDRLVYMANQIAGFFETQPGDVAALQTADHLKSFWDPRMRQAILQHLAAGGADLSPVAAAAVALLRGSVRATPAETLALQGERSASGPGDDAG